MSIVYQNDFEAQSDNWTSTDFIVRDSSWGSVSPVNSLRFNANATLTQNLGMVDTIQYHVNCSMFGAQAFYYDALSVEHEITLPALTCDGGSTWNDTGLLTINDTVTAIKLVSPVGQQAIDDIEINGLTVPGGGSGFTPTQGAAVVTGIGTSLADSLLPILPLIFGLVLVAFLVTWAFNRLVAFFKR